MVTSLKRALIPKRPTQQSSYGHPIDLLPHSYRHSVWWVNGPSCNDCRSTDHMVAHLFSCRTHLMDLDPGNMWVATLQIAQLLAGLPVWPYVGLHHRTTLTPFLHNLHSSVGRPFLSLASGGPHPLHPFLFTPVVRGSIPPSQSNNNLIAVYNCIYIPRKLCWFSTMV